MERTCCGPRISPCPHLHNGAPPRPPAAFLRGVAWKNNQGMFKCRSYLLGTITINILQRADTRRLGQQKHRSILQTSKSKFGWRKNTVADYLHLFVASMSVINLPVPSSHPVCLTSYYFLMYYSDIEISRCNCTKLHY